MSESDEVLRREVLPRRDRSGTRGTGGRDGGARRRRRGAGDGAARATAARRHGAARLSDAGRALRSQALRTGRERRRVLAAVMR